MRRRAKPEKILYVIGRDDWIKSEYMSRMSLSGIRNLGFEIMWEDPSFGWIFRIRKMRDLFPGISRRAHIYILKFVHLFYGLTHWGYFRLRKQLNKSFEFRIENLRNRLGRVGDENEISILSFSSGGRVSSLIADSFKIQRLICIGYPFRNPKEGENPDRYRHLAELKTPMLIIQGNRDEYGGSEVERNVPLSPGIELFFVDSTHDYRLDGRQWDTVLSKIESMLSPGLRPGDITWP